MFTGIITALARVKELTASGSNLDIWLTGDFVHELKIDQSVAHNGGVPHCGRDSGGYL